MRLVCDARRVRHLCAVEVVVLLHRLSCVEANTHENSLVGVIIALGERALDGDSTLDGLASAPERDHETVAFSLYLVALVRLDLFAY